MALMRKIPSHPLPYKSQKPCVGRERPLCSPGKVIINEKVSLIKVSDTEHMFLLD